MCLLVGQDSIIRSPYFPSAIVWKGEWNGRVHKEVKEVMLTVCCVLNTVASKGKSMEATMNLHPNRQFPRLLVVHVPLCLHVLFRVARPLHSNPGGGGGGAREPSVGVCSLGGARIPSCTGGYRPRGTGG